HLAARGPEGDLLEFFWSPRADWHVRNVSGSTGQKVLAEQFTYWQVEDGSGVAEHLAGQSPAGDLLVFFRSPAVPGGEWDLVNISTKTNQKVGGPATSWQTPDGEFIVEHLAARSPSGHLLVFFWSPGADWQVVNVDEIAPGEPVTGALSVYQVFDGQENVEILGGRSASGAMRFVAWQPSRG